MYLLCSCALTCTGIIVLACRATVCCTYDLIQYSGTVIVIGILTNVYVYSAMQGTWQCSAVHTSYQSSRITLNACRSTGNKINSAQNNLVYNYIVVTLS